MQKRRKVSAEELFTQECSFKYTENMNRISKKMGDCTNVDEVMSVILRSKATNSEKLALACLFGGYLYRTCIADAKNCNAEIA